MKEQNPSFALMGSVELHSGFFTCLAGACTDITAPQIEIGLTEGLVLPALATMLKSMYSICATS